MTARLTVAVIGAGFGGIAMAIALKRAGFDDFTVFEQADGPGGTWRHNTYPGASCDIPSHLYCYSFRRHDWSRTHSTQAEILAYIERCVYEFGIRPHCRFGLAVTKLEWHEDRGTWQLWTDSGHTFSANVVVCALGLFTVPKMPDLPGRNEFGGPVFHTARWEHGHDLRGRRVAVIGTGPSGAQVVPSLAAEVGRLDVYQREPGWVLPRDERILTAEERAALRRRFGGWYERGRLFRVTDGMARGLDPESRGNRELVARAKAFLDASVDDPLLRKALTPSHPAFCKRVVFSDDFYATLNRPNVELVPHRVERLTRTGIVAADGVERAVDAIVCGTGFRTTDYLATIDVRGRDGRGLAEVWRDGPQAFLGMAVSGFPNLFMLYGPNAAPPSTSVIFVLERQAEYVTRVVRGMRRWRLAAVEVRPSIEGAYNRWLQARLAATAYTAGCHNHYRLASGLVVTSFPFTAATYWGLTLLGSGSLSPFYRRTRAGRAWVGGRPAPDRAST